MKIANLTSLVLLGAVLAAGAVTFNGSAESTNREVAAVGRYHLRQRTQRFFERSTPTGRDSQKGIYQSLPRPTTQPTKCPTTTA